MKTLLHTVPLLLAVALSLFTASAQRPLTGADQLKTLLPLIDGKHVSLVVNSTSLCGSTHLLDTLLYNKVLIEQVFAPEHGFRGDAAAGETVKDGKDARTGIPLTSLYGKNKKPTARQLERTEVVIFDIQDVGARFYTYISTLYYVMQSCAENGKKLIVLDRPNPCDYVDGPVRQPKYKSFVGMLPIPVLHGCTVGELAQMINGEGWLGKGVQCRLQVIPVKGWKHGQPYSLPVKPSPNLPNDQSVALYASLCPFEGTSVSVGRGTLYPFQLAGSPLLAPSGPDGTPSSDAVSFRFQPQPLKGYDNAPLHAGEYCYGLDLRKAVAPKGFSLQYVIYLYNAYKHAGVADKFFSRASWFDLLMGTNQVRLDLLAGKTEEEIRAKWAQELEAYRLMRKKYLIY
ncbi:MAG: DUF1343 domain-containing protein [Bacteroidales bacterium]|nr:DUF1343 domain-containing protein [Bacteroidales bacterium]